MTNDVAAITAAALALPEEDRADLLARLAESIGGPPGSDEMTDEEWEDEIARRIEDIRSGREKAIPWEEARKQIFGEPDGHPG